MSYTLIGFVVYLLTVLVIGIITYRRNKNHDDYFLGGRKLSPLLVAFSERTSAESAWLLLGMPGVAMATGLIEVWTAVGCVLGIIFIWLYIARDIRETTEKHDSITIPNFLARKFSIESDDKFDKLIRITSTLIIIFFFTFYLAAQFNGAGKVFFVTFGLDEKYGILIGSAAIIFYTLMGGFLAVVWTDLIQGIFMIATLVVLPIVGFIVLGQIDVSFSGKMVEMGSDFISLSGGKTGWAGIAAVIGGLSWGLGYMGQPHIVTKFMAIGDPNKMNVGRNIAFSWAIPAFAGSLLIGYIGLAYFGAGHFSDVEFVMPALANELLPGWLAGFFISAAIAAMMSTADSQLLIISSSFIEDFYHRTLGRKVSDKAMLNLSRLITFLVGITALILALTSKELIYSLVSYAWSGLGSSFGPALLLMLKWKRTTKYGVLAGMIAGASSTIIWSNIPGLEELITVRFSSFVIAFVAVIAVSLMTGRKVIR